jgi:60 kDa SS-A/Ro ribonucleoprotein
MANKNIFKSAGTTLPAADTTNLAGGKAYSMTDKHALAQFACTGMFGNTFYSDAVKQLEEIKSLVNKVDTAFISSLAVYSRNSAFMKDMPAFLLATLAARDIDMFKITFPKVMDNGKMVRNFVQIMRSGVTGRKSLGTAPKRMIEKWLETRSDNQIFNDSVGNDPSLSDIIKMVHPRPETKTREALYAYIMDKKHDASVLPGIVQEFEAFKAAMANKNRNFGEAKIPNVNFQMLTALPLATAEWESIARHAKWQMTRMNLNTFARHGVFKNSEIAKLVADRLRDKSLVEKAKAFPYQLFTAYLNTEQSTDIPQSVINALQDAMEHSIENVPTFSGKIFVGVDISGSMDSSVSGYRGSATSKTSCRQVAALIASAIKRKNEETEVFTFDTQAKPVNLNGRDSVMTNARKIATPGGGTDCSSFVRLLNENSRKGDLVIVVSDNESWYDRGNYHGPATTLMSEWQKFKNRNPKAKLVCIDLTPNTTVQAPDAKERLNVGGFSDAVFTVIDEFVKGTGEPEYWVKKITEFDGASRSVASTTETDDGNKLE